METEENFEDVTEMDLIYDAHDKVDALIELLIEKKIITENEFENKLKEFVEEIDEQE